MRVKTLYLLFNEAHVNTKARFERKFHIPQISASFPTASAKRTAPSVSRSPRVESRLTKVQKSAVTHAMACARCHGARPDGARGPALDAGDRRHRGALLRRAPLRPIRWDGATPGRSSGVARRAGVAARRGRRGRGW